jgi:hypothetical protein
MNQYYAISTHNWSNARIKFLQIMTLSILTVAYVSDGYAQTESRRDTYVGELLLNFSDSLSVLDSLRWNHFYESKTLIPFEYSEPTDTLWEQVEGFEGKIDRSLFGKYHSCISIFGREHLESTLLDGQKVEIYDLDVMINWKTANSDHFKLTILLSTHEILDLESWHSEI